MKQPNFFAVFLLFLATGSTMQPASRLFSSLHRARRPVLLTAAAIGGAGAFYRQRVQTPKPLQPSLAHYNHRGFTVELGEDEPLPLIFALHNEEEKCSGCLWARINEDETELVINWIKVEAPYRRQGAGTLLIATAVEQALKTYPNLKRVGLIVFPTNLQARKLYQSLGFIAVAEDGEYIRMQADPHVVFQRACERLGL